MASESERLAALLGRDGMGYAVIYGAAVTVLLSVIPFSPLAGGAVAAARYGRGYLLGSVVGTLAGILAAIPLGLLFVPAFGVANSLGIGIEPGAPAYDLFLTIVATLFVAYTVGLSALGGPLGVALGRHTDLQVDPASWV